MISFVLSALVAGYTLAVLYLCRPPPIIHPLSKPQTENESGKGNEDSPAFQEKLLAEVSIEDERLRTVRFAPKAQIATFDNEETEISLIGLVDVVWGYKEREERDGILKVRSYG